MKVLKWTAIAVGAALGSSSDGEKGSVDELAATAPAEETAVGEGDLEESATPEPDPPALPEPDGKYELTCDYELGDFGESGVPDAGYTFIGGDTIENTGNIGIKTEVTYKWRLLGRGSLVERQTYKLRPGREKDVDILVPVTDADIDAHQSADGDCKTSVEMVDTFGRVKE